MTKYGGSRNPLPPPTPTLSQFLLQQFLSPSAPTPDHGGRGKVLCPNVHVSPINSHVGTLSVPRPFPK